MTVKRTKLNRRAKIVRKPTRLPALCSDSSTGRLSAGQVATLALVAALRPACENRTAQPIIRA